MFRNYLRTLLCKTCWLYLWRENGKYSIVWLASHFPQMPPTVIINPQWGKPKEVFYLFCARWVTSSSCEGGFSPISFAYVLACSRIRQSAALGRYSDLWLWPQSSRTYHDFFFSFQALPLPSVTQSEFTGWQESRTMLSMKFSGFNQFLARSSALFLCLAITLYPWELKMPSVWSISTRCHNRPVGSSYNRPIEWSSL